MAWVRIHDGAMQDLKITALSDSAFRLWIRGLCYCQTALTDGLIPRSALREVGAKRKDVEMLSSVLVDGRAPLWEAHPIGFKVHDYLAWNDCRDKVVERQAEARARKQAYQERKRAERAAKKAAEVERVPNASGTRHPLNGEPNQTKPNLTKPQTPTESVSRRNSRERPLALPHIRRFKVWRWMVEDCMALLGEHLEAFGFDDWLERLDKRDNAVVTETWPWLKDELVAEIKAQGLPVAGYQPVSARGQASADAMLRAAARVVGQ